MKTDRISILQRENIIWVIYVLFAILGIKANNLEIEDIYNKQKNNKKSYTKINIFIFIISIIIYSYFVWLSYKKNKEYKDRNSFLILVGTILTLIAVILFLYVELDKNNKEVIPNEI